MNKTIAVALGLALLCVLPAQALDREHRQLTTRAEVPLTDRVLTEGATIRIEPFTDGRSFWDAYDKWRETSAWPNAGIVEDRGQEFGARGVQPFAAHFENSAFTGGGKLQLTRLVYYDNLLPFIGETLAQGLREAGATVVDSAAPADLVLKGELFSLFEIEATRHWGFGSEMESYNAPLYATVVLETADGRVIWEGNVGVEWVKGRRALERTIRRAVSRLLTDQRFRAALRTP